MAVRAAIQYLGHYVIRELGLGCYAAASAAAAATSLRLLDASLFDPIGGTIWVEDIDALITYTGINLDILTGIPSSSTGSIAATINPYTSSSRDLIWRCELINSYELELMIDRYRKDKYVEKLQRDADRKKYWALRGWFDTGVQLRNADDDDYDVVTPDVINYERGSFEFTTARSESEELWVVGPAYNPFAVIGDFIESFANDQRWYSYSQVGQSAHSSKNAREIADLWRARGKYL